MLKPLRKLFAMLAFTAALTLSARNSGDVDNPHFGVRVTYDYNNTTSYNHIVHGGSGFSAGASYYAPIGRIAYFNTGLMFFYDTFEYDGETGEDATLARINGSLSMLGLKLPLQIGVKFYQTRNVRISVMTGPQLYYNFSMRSKFDRERAGDLEHVAKTVNSNGMDVTWGIGAAVDFNRHWHLQAEYNIGLVDFTSVRTIDIGYDGSLKRSEFSVGIGYNF
ncbi:MAG: PorT family protein [Muribaculaceae bacterium]|nr:PorT family protein [Muribaculaceae bacterium]